MPSAGWLRRRLQPTPYLSLALCFCVFSSYRAFSRFFLVLLADFIVPSRSENDKFILHGRGHLTTPWCCCANDRFRMCSRVQWWYLFKGGPPRSVFGSRRKHKHKVSRRSHNSCSLISLHHCRARAVFRSAVNSVLKAAQLVKVVCCSSVKQVDSLLQASRRLYNIMPLALLGLPAKWFLSTWRAVLDRENDTQLVYSLAFPAMNEIECLRFLPKYHKKNEQSSVKLELNIKIIALRTSKLSKNWLLQCSSKNSGESSTTCF